MSPNSKHCTRCLSRKSTLAFNARRATKDGLSPWCRKCRSQYNTAWSKNNAHAKETQTDYRMRRQFGISLLVYKEMLAGQHDVCKICGKPDPCGKKLAVDHCHKTGKVRGLLCLFCNTALGALKDDMVIIEKALAYVRQHSQG